MVDSSRGWSTAMLALKTETLLFSCSSRWSARQLLLYFVFLVLVFVVAQRVPNTQM